jgi:hypothetical protein
MPHAAEAVEDLRLGGREVHEVDPPVRGPRPGGGVGARERRDGATCAGQEPAIAEDAVIDTLVAVWINAVYGTPGWL